MMRGKPPQCQHDFREIQIVHILRFKKGFGKGDNFIFVKVSFRRNYSRIF